MFQCELAQDRHFERIQIKDSAIHVPVRNAQMSRVKLDDVGVHQMYLEIILGW
jgi:hypothetical protein